MTSFISSCVYFSEIDQKHDIVKLSCEKPLKIYEEGILELKINSKVKVRNEHKRGENTYWTKGLDKLIKDKSKFGF